MYDQADLNDQDDFSDDQDARRAAEASMERRDRRAARAAGAAGERRKARMPGFLASDEEDSEDEGQLLGRRRVRRMYDEPFGDDDAGYDEVSAARCAAKQSELMLHTHRKCRLSNSATSAPTRSRSGSRNLAQGGRSLASSATSS